MQDKIADDYNLIISNTKTKTMVFKRMYSVINKIEQNIGTGDISYDCDNGVLNKQEKFQIISHTFISTHYKIKEKKGLQNEVL